MNLLFKTATQFIYIILVVYSTSIIGYAQNNDIEKQSPIKGYTRDDVEEVVRITDSNLQLLTQGNKKSTVPRNQISTTIAPPPVYNQHSSEGYGAYRESYELIQSRRNETKGTNLLIIGFICILTIVICVLFLYIYKKKNHREILNIIVLDENLAIKQHQEKPIELETPLILGRSKECSIYIADEKLSRRHASIRLSVRGLSIKDNGSKNGIIFKSKKLQAHKYIRLYPHKLYKMGNVNLKFYLNSNNH